MERLPYRMGLPAIHECMVRIFLCRVTDKLLGVAPALTSRNRREAKTGEPIDHEGRCDPSGLCIATERDRHSCSVLAVLKRR